MARVGRLAGALLVETGGAYYLVGNTKVPCDWRAHGFESPGELDAMTQPVVRLSVRPSVRPSVHDDTPRPGMPSPAQQAAHALGAPQLTLETEGEAAAELVARAFVIPRTGSVSERLWRLVIGESDEDDRPLPEVISARWLGEAPPAVWQIVRDSVLRCS